MATSQLPCGEEQLFLPHRLFIQSATFRTPNADILREAGPTPARHFPFVATVQVAQLQTKCAPLVRIRDLSTSTGSHTDPSNEVRSLAQVGKELQGLKRSLQLNAALFQYADPQGPGVDGDTDARRAFLSALSQKVGVPQVNSLTTAPPRGAAQQPLGLGHRSIDDHSFPFANANQQYDAAVGLAGWFNRHAGRGPQPVESEVAVQDQVADQLLEPLEMILRSRYESADNRAIIDENKQISFPTIGRPVASFHSEKAGRSRSGYPDFIMLGKAPDGIRDALDRHQHSVVEVKSKWCYEDRAVFDRIRDEADALLHPRDPDAPDHDGQNAPRRRFKWGHNSLAVKLLMQIWGEIQFFQCNWGFIVNGSKVLLFVKTDHRELTVGTPIDFDDPGLLQTLAGIYFASIDETRREGLAQFLCGETEEDWGPAD